jgi:hypothetical protein
MMLGTLSVSAYALLAAWAFPAMNVAAAAALCWVVAAMAVSVPGYLWLRRRADEPASRPGGAAR